MKSSKPSTSKSIYGKIRSNSSILQNKIIDGLNKKFEQFYQVAYKRTLEKKITTQDIEEIGSNLQENVSLIVIETMEEYLINLYNDLDEIFLEKEIEINSLIKLDKRDLQEKESTQISEIKNKTRKEIAGYKSRKSDTKLDYKDDTQHKSSNTMKLPYEDDFKLNLITLKDEIVKFLDNRKNKTASLEELNKTFGYSKFSLQSLLNKLEKEDLVIVKSGIIKLK